MTRARQWYAHARVQSRRAALPDAAQWRVLDSSRDLEHYLEELPAAAVGPELAALRSAAGPAERERRLLEAWRARCREVARWHPPAWRPAFEWCAELPLLPALAALQAHEAVPAAALAGAAPAEGEPLRGPLATLATVDAAALADAWIERFRALWPSPDGRTRRGLERLIGIALAATRPPAAPAEAAGGEPAVDALLERVERASRRLFRTTVGTPTASFAYLLAVGVALLHARAGCAARLVTSGESGLRSGAA